MGNNRNSRGFSILELMIGMAVFLVVSGSILIAMSQLQANYRTTEVSTQMQQQLRSTMELMAAEIGQAGLQASTVEGGMTGGDATFTTPYKLTIPSTGLNNVAVNIASASGVFSPYVGQWLMVDGGIYQEPVQVQGIQGATSPCGTVPANYICGNFQNPHTVNTPTAAYPMGVFPHGILSDQSNPSATGAGKLAMFGEINGSGNGLWAVEYACPPTFPGPLTRTVWSVNPFGAATKYNLIDNVTACYFCWPGVTTAQNPNCPAGAVAPQTVTLYNGVTASSTSTYSIITQVGFTITAMEPVTISGSTQNITVTKSYSNVQPRNLVTANNIYNAAVNSAITAGTCTAPCPYNIYAGWLIGELQPDPPNLASIPW